MARRVVLPGLAALLAALGGTARWWLRPLLRFVAVNASMIQGLQSLVQLMLWCSAGLVAVVLGVRGLGHKLLPDWLPAWWSSTDVIGPQCQLPRDIEDFVDREEELARVRKAFSERRGRDEPVAVFVIGGAAGVGKSALAIKAAHQLRRRYRDGQLYMKLRTPQGQPIDAEEILAVFLRALSGEQAVIPPTMHERESAYRARMSGRRVLVVLDDAVSEEDVRPLLPGSGTCAVLITSRSLLAALPGRRQKLAVLDPRRAVELLGKVSGDEQRVANEPDQAKTIVEYCGYLPLAVRICGAQLAPNAEWSLATLVDRFQDERNDLAQLRAGDLGINASLAISYDALDAKEQAAFRLLGLVKAPDFPAWSAVSLLGVSWQEAQALLAELIDAQLLEGTGEDRMGQLRYGFHTLLYQFAQERLAKDEPAASQQAARRRLLDTYLDLAEQARRHLQPGLPPQTPTAASVTTAASIGIPERTMQVVREEPLTWFDIEREGLLAAIQVAADLGQWSLCVQLADTLAAFFEFRTSWDDWRLASSLALHAARQADDPHLLAKAMRTDGDLLRDQRHWNDANEQFTQCLALFRELGDRSGEASTMQSIGSLYRDQGDWEAAIRWYRQCLMSFQQLGDQRGRAFALHDISVAHRNNGDWSAAIAGFQECLQVFQQLGELRGEAATWRGIGVAYRNLGQWADGIACFDQALPLFEKVGDRRGLARTLANRADVYQEQRQWARAIEDLESCLKVHQDLGDERLEADTRRRMSVLYRKKGNLRKALQLLNDPRCLPALAELDEHRWRHYATHNLGEAFLALGRLGEARDLFEECLPYFQGRGEGHHDRLWEAKSLYGLGLVLAKGSSSGESKQAAERLNAALTIFRDLGAPEAAETERQLERLNSPAERSPR